MEWSLMLVMDKSINGAPEQIPKSPQVKPLHAVASTL